MERSAPVAGSGGGGGYSPTGDLAVGGTASGTLTGGGGNAALVDGNTGTYGYDPAGLGGTSEFGVQLAGRAAQITRLVIVNDPTYGVSNAETYDFRYSDDGSTWTTVGSFTIATGGGTFGATPGPRVHCSRSGIARLLGLYSNIHRPGQQLHIPVRSRHVCLVIGPWM